MTNTATHENDDMDALAISRMVSPKAAARLILLSDGRISITGVSPTHATKIAQALQRMGSNVRQYGSILIVHGEDQ